MPVFYRKKAIIYREFSPENMMKPILSRGVMLEYDSIINSIFRDKTDRSIEVEIDDLFISIW